MSGKKKMKGSNEIKDYMYPKFEDYEFLIVKHYTCLIINDL